MLDEKLAAEIVDVVKGFLTKATDPLKEQIEHLQKELPNLIKEAATAAAAEVQLHQPKDGKDGSDGKDGLDGKDGDPGTDGKDGSDGKDGVDGTDGEDGRSPSEDEIKQLIERILPGMLTKAVEAIPPAKDGKDGLDGVDATDINILPAIDESKSYRRGTYATHNGGLWKSHAQTDGMRGWECVVDGIAGIEVKAYDDDERTFGIAVTRSTGNVTLKNITLPVMIYRGVWAAGSFKKDDTVTYDGSLWAACEDTADAPKTSAAWKLVAKKGRDGNPPTVKVKR